MKITIESTEDFAQVRGIPCRLWCGTDEKGQPVIAGVLAVGIAAEGDRAEFERDLAFLAEAAPPTLLPRAHTMS